jgi:anthranilate phosphoribosyltransferase
MKGETVPEITGCAQVMREKVVKVKTKHSVVIDTCGTGGDAIGTFNISTCAAFVAAGAGAIVAKHGNRAVSSRCGSADVLKALGVKVEGITLQQVEQCLDDIGIAFLFAPMLHGAMKFAAPVRRELGVRTIFNILGPLTNPAGAKRQLIGVFDERLCRPLAEVLSELGTERAMVVHGAGGCDEISNCGLSTVCEVKGDEVRLHQISQRDFGMKIASVKDLLGGDVETNANILRSILHGEDGPRRDVVLLNAGAAITIAGLAETLAEGVQLAKDSIDSGKAKNKLAELIEVSNL